MHLKRKKNIRTPDLIMKLRRKLISVRNLVDDELYGIHTQRKHFQQKLQGNVTLPLVCFLTREKIYDTFQALFTQIAKNNNTEQTFFSSLLALLKRRIAIHYQQLKRLKQANATDNFQMLMALYNMLRVIIVEKIKMDLVDEILA